MLVKKLNKSEDYFLILFIALLFIVISSFLTFSFAVFLIQILLSFITFPLIIRRNYQSATLYLIIFIVSTCFVFLVFVANQMTYGVPYYIGGSDDLKFEEKGMLVADSKIYEPSKLLGNILDKYDNAPFFSLYIALLINFANLFGGYSTFIPRIVNVHFLIWIAMIFEYFIRKYANFSDKKAKICVALFALTPNIQYINSHVFRDTMNYLQILLILYLFDKLISKKKYINKIFILSLLFFLIYITFYTRKNALAFAGVLCLFILAERFRLKKRYIAIMFIPALIMTNFTKIIRLEYFIKTYSNYVLNIAGDGLSSFIFRQPLIPFGIILRVLYALISPFPNFLGLFQDLDKLLYDFVMMLIYTGVLIQIAFIPFILKRLLKFDWLATSFLICFLSIVSTTFTFRHVILYYPFLVGVGVDGYINFNPKTKKIILFFWIIIIVLLALFYISLKLFN